MDIYDTVLAGMIALLGVGLSSILFSAAFHIVYSTTQGCFT